MSGKRRRPYAVKKTVGWHVNPETGKSVQEQITIGYVATRAEGLQMLAEYNNNPFDIKASKATFQEVYERWSKEKFPTISKSNVKGYEASYRVCGTLYNKVFRHIRLMDLQFVVDTCGKTYPTLKAQGAVQPAVCLRHEKRHLQQGLLRVRGFEPVQRQEPQQT